MANSLRFPTALLQCFNFLPQLAFATEGILQVAFEGGDALALAPMSKLDLVPFMGALRGSGDCDGLPAIFCLRRGGGIGLIDGIRNGRMR